VPRRVAGLRWRMCSARPRAYGAGMRAMQVAPPGMPDEFVIALGSWDATKSELLAKVVRAAGSLRRAVRVLDVPRSTLGVWALNHRQRGTWPA
jgi:hypothetical protein